MRVFLFTRKQTPARIRIHTNKITQGNSPGNPLGSELLQRNSRHVFRVQQMLHAIEKRRNAHEESRNGGQCLRQLCARWLSRPSAPRRHRESESAAAEGELSQGQGPKKSVVWMRKRARQVHYEYEDQQRHPDESRCQPCLDEKDNTERRRKKSDAHQINPKRMRGNPAWNEGRNTRGSGEMLGTKNGHGNRKKQPA